MMKSVNGEYETFNIPPHTLNMAEAPYSTILNLYSGINIVAYSNISLSINALG